MVRANCKVILAGNHDHYEIKKIPYHKAGYEFPKS